MGIRVYSVCRLNIVDTFGVLYPVKIYIKTLSKINVSIPLQLNTNDSLTELCHKIKINSHHLADLLLRYVTGMSSVINLLGI